MKPYTVLLLRPDYVTAAFGHDTFCAHVRGDTPEVALNAARAAACEADNEDTPEDYYCLFCADGHVIDYQDGAGGVCTPNDQHGPGYTHKGAENEHVEHGGE